MTTEPGATISTQAPMLEGGDVNLLSFRSDAPTVTEPVLEPGENAQESAPLFPAADTTTTPASKRADTARLTVSETGPLRDRLDINM